jgi:hypothetical protein
VDENFAVLEPDRKNFVVDFLLPMARLKLFALDPMDIGTIFRVEAVQAMRLLVDKSVVLGDELPPNLRGNNASLGSRVRYGGSRGHSVCCVE